MRKQLVSGKKLLLFVDTGDNCRCPLAIGYLTKLLQQKNIDYVELKHMGVMTPNDLLPTPEVVQLLKEEGVDIRYHRSRPVNDDLIRQADLVLGFTAIHVQTCLRRVPECKPKTFLLKEYVGLAHTGDQIHDPMGSTMEIFKKYFTEIKQSLHKLMEMDFIAAPPEPKEVVILPTIVKPRSAVEEDDLPAGYYDEEELAIKRAKAAKEKRILKAEIVDEEDTSSDLANKSKSGKKSTAVKPAKKEAKPEKKEKTAKAEPKKAVREAKAAVKPKPAAKAAAKEKAAPAAKSAKADKTAKAVKEDKPAKKVASKPAAKAKAAPAKKAAASTKKSHK